MLEIGSSETRVNLVDLLSTRLANGADVSNLKSSRREPLVKEGNTRFQDALRQQGQERAQAVRNERSEGRYGAIVSETARQTRNIGNRQSAVARNEEKLTDQNRSVPENSDKNNRMKSVDRKSGKVQEEVPAQDSEEASQQMVLSPSLAEESTLVMVDITDEEVAVVPMPQPEQSVQQSSQTAVVGEAIIGAEADQVVQVTTLPPAVMEELENILKEAGITAEMLEGISAESIPAEADALIQWLKAEGEGLRTRILEAGAEQLQGMADQETISTGLLAASAASDTGAELNDDQAESAHREALVETVSLEEQPVSFQQVAVPAGEETDATQQAVSKEAGTFETGMTQPDKILQPATVGTRPTFASVREQFSAHLQRMQAEGKNEMQLQLKPDHLGRLHLRVVEERGHVLAKFTAESEQVRAILESNMQLLKDALEKNGVTVTALEVSVEQREGRESDEKEATGRERIGHAHGIRNGTSSFMSAQVVSERLRQWLDGPTATVSFKA